MPEKAKGGVGKKAEVKEAKNVEPKKTERKERPKKQAPKERGPAKKPVKLPLLTTGKRKRAVARATFREGSGVIRINRKSPETAFERMNALRVAEAIELAREIISGYDVDIHVSGGGHSGQAEACRVAIAKGLAELGGDKVREAYLAYDRNLLVYDPRRTEPHKPPRSSKGARRYKQRSKR